MDQLALFPPTEYEMDMAIKQLKVEVGNVRRGAFKEITDLKKDYEFLQTQLEILMDLMNGRAV